MSGCTSARQALRKGLNMNSSRSSIRLPFLYQTATLRRCYSELRSISEAHSSKDSSENSDRRRASRGQGSRIRKLPVRDPDNAQVKRFSKSKNDYASGSMPFEKNLGAREDFVPFENVQPSRIEGIIPKAVEDTTLTPTEQRAFEKLESLAVHSSTSNRESEKDYTSLDDILNEAISASESRIVDEVPFTLPKQKGSNNMKKSKPGPDVSIRKFAFEPQDRPRAIYQAIDSATTDLELWNVLEHDVFRLVSSLDLDGTNENAPNATTIKDDMLQISDNHRRSIMATFPGQLTAAASVLRSSFPTSNLILSLLPRLRALGPSAHALGSSPKLYNQIIAFLFEKYSDLDSINDLLAEMDREVIEPNATTLRLIDTMLGSRESVMKLQYGTTTKAVWSTEKFTRGFEVLRRWKGRVEKVLLEVELREERRRKALEAKEGEGERNKEENEERVRRYDEMNKDIAGMSGKENVARAFKYE